MGTHGKYTNHCLRQCMWSATPRNFKQRVDIYESIAKPLSRKALTRKALGNKPLKQSECVHKYNQIPQGPVPAELTEEPQGYLQFPAGL